MPGDATSGSGGSPAGVSKTDELRHGLAKIVKQYDDVLTSIAGTKRAADDAYDHFLGLGGSAGRAQIVADLITDLHTELTGLEGLTDEVNSTIDEIDQAITPKENINKLDAVTEKLETIRSETDAIIDACDDAVREVHENLRGSDQASDIADQVAAARDQLDETRSGIADLIEGAMAQQEAFRGQLRGVATVSAAPGSPTPATPDGTLKVLPPDEVRRRAEDKVSAVDQPLEGQTPVGHGHSRHGHQTTDAQQAERIRTGIAPDGVWAPTNRATRFRSPEAEAEAFDRGRAELEADLLRDAVAGWADPQAGGKSFVDPSTGALARHTVWVRSSDPRGFGEAVHVPRRVGGAGSQKLRDANGNLVPQRIDQPHHRARVTFEYVPSADEWRVLSYFPEP
jgi:hypothetical protein